MFCNVLIIVSLSLLWNYDLVMIVINMYNISGTPDNIISLSRILSKNDILFMTVEDRRNDARLAMMYKIANKNVAITKQNRHKPPLR